MPIRTTYSNSRNKLASLLERVINEKEIVIINCRGREDVALVSASELSSLLETVHLIRSPKNSQRLLKALDRAQTKGLSKQKEMSDLKKYIAKRKSTDAEFAESYEEGYENFKIGILLRQARESAGITQDEVAKKLQTKKSAISRIENHSEDIRLSTLRKYAEALGKQIRLEIS